MKTRMNPIDLKMFRQRDTQRRFLVAHALKKYTITAHTLLIDLSLENVIFVCFVYFTVMISRRWHETISEISSLNHKTGCYNSEWSMKESPTLHSVSKESHNCAREFCVNIKNNSEVDTTVTILGNILKQEEKKRSQKQIDKSWNQKLLYRQILRRSKNADVDIYAPSPSV